MPRTLDSQADSGMIVMTSRLASQNGRGDDCIAVRLISLLEGEYIREAVLRSTSTEWKSQTNVDMFHVGGCYHGNLVTCASFVQEHSEAHGPLRLWRLRAMATLQESRGKGVGGKVLEFGIGEVSRRGGILVWCEGRVGAIRFYEEFLFHAIGPTYENTGTGAHRILVRPVTDGV